MSINTDAKKIADLLFSHITKNSAEIEEKYPTRQLPEGAAVTRFAPSPTGFVHFGSLFPAVVSERLAHRSGGVFYLRIEDTDSKREVEGAIGDIIDCMQTYSVEFDEGVTKDGEKGIYGPYKQSERVEIYQTYAKELLEKGLAYPCFLTKDELDEIRKEQEAKKLLPGCYQGWSRYRDADYETVKACVENKIPYVIRLRSPGRIGARIKFTDLIKGELELDENYIDEVILKSDGIPTYHFAHAVDDHLMGTTHVVRGEEWLSSLPKHLQLFDVLGFKRPKYCHISLLMKQDGDSKRKLSKRHDPEAAINFYKKEGYPSIAVKKYVMSVLNSNYEQWQKQNPTAFYEDFDFSVKKMSASGALFDIQKLNDISKNEIAKMTANEIYEKAVEWSELFDSELYELLKDEVFAKKIFKIGRETEKPRKDIVKYSDIRQYLSFFYDSLFEYEDDFPENVSTSDAVSMLEKFADCYDENDDKTVWFDKVSAIGEGLGFAAKTKDYKENPENYKGHVGDVSMVIRIAVCGRKNAPDLFDVMQVLGADKTVSRIKNAINELKRG